MKLSNAFKIGLALGVFTLLCPGMSWGDLSILFFDDFDDGDYNGWSVTTWEGKPANPPDVVPSPEGYSIRGVGSGYSQDPGLNVHISHPLSLSNVGKLKIEMRAKSGPQWPNQASVHLVSGSDCYGVRDYGEAGENETADWWYYVSGSIDYYRYYIDGRAFEWHDFAWTRDPNGWWSLTIDDSVEWKDFYQDSQLTSFDRIAIQLLRNQSEIEWVCISDLLEEEEVIHDECANAIPVQANEPYDGSTEYATGTDTSSCSYNDTNDVWHSFTPKFNYEYTISLCGSAFDTTLSVFDDCNGTELACNDDTDQEVCPSKLDSQLTMPLVKDSTYFIRIAGYNKDTGDYTLTIIGPECAEPPAMDFNDDCKVDFQDFAIFCQSWLDCGLDPNEVCWQ